MRATARLADVSFNTVAKLLIDAGEVRADLHDELVRDVTASRVQCDEDEDRFNETLNRLVRHRPGKGNGRAGGTASD